MEAIKQEIRYALRILMRNPIFALVAILTLAIGIGANSAIFSAVYSVLLKPLPYKDPERLVFLFSRTDQVPFMTVSPPDFVDYSKRGPFQEMSAFDTGTLDLTGKGDPERLTTAVVSWNFFRLMGVPLQTGRGFIPDEGKMGGNKVVILSHGLWKRSFGGDPHILGSSIVLDGIKWTIIGIAPRGFEYPRKTEVWRPLRFTPEEVSESQRGAHWLRVVARLAPNVSMEQAQQRVSLIAADLGKLNPRTNSEITSVIQPFQGFQVRKLKPALLVLWASVGFVLLIACVNVTNLLLAQAARRESEVAIRTALGAGKWRLMRQFLVESLVLSVAASFLGVLIGLWATELLNRYGSPTLPALADVHLNQTVLIFTIAISIFTGVLIGLAPALQNVRKAMPRKLKSGVRVSSRNRLRRALAVSEIATALILLAGAGLLIKSFYRLIDVDPGFRSDHVLTFQISLPDMRYPKPHQSTDFYQELIQRLRQHGEVQSSAAVFGLPLTDGYNARTSFELIARPKPAEEPHAGLRVITSEYFQTMGIRMLNGRNFLSSDTQDSSDVVIISESAARMYYPNENPIGQKIRIHVTLVERESGQRTIIGVVRDVRFEGLDVLPQADLYIPHSQQPLTAMMMVVRTSGDPQNIVPAVREELRRIDSNLPLSAVETMDEIVGESMSERKFTMLLLSAFALVGLFLAALGTYGVLAFQVVQRTQEIGIRIALGAAKKDVLKLVLQEGLFLAVAGSVIGFLGVLATSRFLRSLLFGVSTLDAGTFSSVVILLAAVAMFACYVPALRATKVDPITTLRYE